MVHRKQRRCTAVVLNRRRIGGRGLHAGDGDARIGAQRPQQRGGIEEELRRRQQWSLKVSAQVAVTIVYFPFKSGGSVDRLCVQHQRGVRWQVVEEALGGIEKERQVVLDAARCVAIANAPVQRRLLWIA